MVVAMKTVMSKPHLKAIVLMCLAVVAWTSASIASVFIPAHYSPFQIVWERYGWHILFLLIAVWSRQRTRLWHSQRPWLQLFRASSMLVMPILFIVATGRLAAEDFWAYFWVAPLVGVIIAPFALREPVSTEKMVAVLAGTTGVLLMFQPNFFASKLGIISAVGAGVCLSIFLILCRVLQAENAFTGLLYTALCVFVPISFVQPWVWQAPSARELLAVLGMSTCWFFVLFLLDAALELAPLTVLAPYLLLEPVLAFSVGYLGFGLKLNLLTTAGAILVLMAVGFSFFRDTSLKQPVVQNERFLGQN